MSLEFLHPGRPVLLGLGVGIAAGGLGCRGLPVVSGGVREDLVEGEGWAVDRRVSASCFRVYCRHIESVGRVNAARRETALQAGDPGTPVPLGF